MEDERYCRKREAASSEITTELVDGPINLFVDAGAWGYSPRASVFRLNGCCVGVGYIFRNVWERLMRWWSRTCIQYVSGRYKHGRIV